MAHIVMNSQQVIELANKCIQFIRKERERQIEESIDNRMTTRKWILFGPYPANRGEAIRLLDKDSNIFGWKSRYGCNTESRLLSLIDLAKLSDEVYIDDDNVNDLNYWETIQTS